MSEIFEIQGANAGVLRRERLRISAESSRRVAPHAFNAPQFAGEFTTRVTPVPIPNTEVKPRWADGTARVSVWEIR